LRLRTHPRGHIKPCLPLPAERPPSGPDWLHEIKHDGFRIMARRDANGVRLYTRTDTISPAASRRSRESPPVCTSRASRTATTSGTRMSRPPIRMARGASVSDHPGDEFIDDLRA